jgi:hypothetical protein
VSHAVFGEWTYSGENESWCGVTLSGNDHKMVGDVEVTCKRCIKQTPTFTTEQRNIAFEYLAAWRAGFDDGMAHQIRTKAVLDLWPGWPGGVADLARVILSGGK